MKIYFVSLSLSLSLFGLSCLLSFFSLIRAKNDVYMMGGFHIHNPRE